VRPRYLSPLLLTGSALAWLAGCQGDGPDNRTPISDWPHAGATPISDWPQKDPAGSGRADAGGFAPPGDVSNDTSDHAGEGEGPVSSGAGPDRGAPASLDAGVANLPTAEPGNPTPAANAGADASESDSAADAQTAPDSSL
jgi:hypothetical protein